MENKIRVRFIDQVATMAETFKKGREYELPESFARSQIATGDAVEIGDRRKPQPDPAAAGSTDTEAPAAGRRRGK